MTGRWAGTTHWDGCWRAHHQCAITLIERLTQTGDGRSTPSPHHEVPAVTTPTTHQLVGEGWSGTRFWAVCACGYRVWRRGDNAVQRADALMSEHIDTGGFYPRIEEDDDL